MAEHAQKNAPAGTNGGGESGTAENVAPPNEKASGKVRAVVPDLANTPFVFASIQDMDDLLKQHHGGPGSTAFVLWLALLKIAYDRDSLDIQVGMGELLRRTGTTDRRQLSRTITRLEESGFIRVDRDATPGKERKANRYSLLRGPYKRAGGSGKKSRPPSGKKSRGSDLKPVKTHVNSLARSHTSSSTPTGEYTPVGGENEETYTPTGAASPLCERADAAHTGEPPDGVEEKDNTIATGFEWPSFVGGDA